MQLRRLWKGLLPRFATLHIVGNGTTIAKFGCSNVQNILSEATLVRLSTWESFPQLLEYGVFRDLLNSAALIRLADIAFIGAIDRLRNTLKSGTRYDHSISVAYLAYLATIDRNASEQATAISAALLHDIGHGPLSHSTEGYFKREFGIDHKTEGRRRLTHDREIRKILRSHHVDIERVEQLVFSKEPDDLSYLFHYPINIDTIEGITRCARSFGVSDKVPDTNDLVQLLMHPDEEARTAGDDFWRLKDAVYNHYILSPFGVIRDAVSQIVLEDLKVGKEAFFIGDTEFLAKYGTRMKLISEQIVQTVQDEKLTYERLDTIYREFGINQEFEVHEPKDLARRYG